MVITAASTLLATGVEIGGLLRHRCQRQISAINCKFCADDREKFVVVDLAGQTYFPRSSFESQASFFGLNIEAKVLE